ncbi:ABC transporter ATP-binding protein [Clostridium grantii]|uniref:ABC-2 type transport system ATP-binding protein n=1 Tax=Clostridium grantii DSM 8605 TaxID=1121316 RepID=A0A1M5XBQ8_9CLOT|nr:ABC transporter ATP-binding protein [Clostridium grantii]SHH96944.1 ABC-2 type transport system ATP-binding protein [Clostridium grantii DSM 8605]
MLQIENLYKNYGKFNAVDDLSLNIEEGEIFGFVGPNGAGKTTTMKIICGLLSATKGQVYVNGVDAIKNSKEVKSYIGYMPDFFGVYDDLKVSEYLNFYASIYGITGNESKKVCADLLELIDLSNKKDAYVDSLSRGMKQRLCLARSLVHNPKILILDEPASGMDPRARFHMKEILKNLKDMGKTIIISSHILSELSEICTTIGIIDHGKIVIKGSVDEIMDKVYKNRTIKIKVTSDISKAIRCLKEHSAVDNIIEGENKVDFDFVGNDVDMNNLLKELIKNEVPLVTFSQVDGNLEDIFMRVTNGGEV